MFFTRRPISDSKSSPTRPHSLLANCPDSISCQKPAPLFLSIRAGSPADLPRRICRCWRLGDECRFWIAGYPPELTLRLDDPEMSRPGSTRIPALVCADSILCGQISDGEIVLVRPDGTIRRGKSGFVLSWARGEIGSHDKIPGKPGNPSTIRTCSLRPKRLRPQGKIGGS